MNKIFSHFKKESCRIILGFSFFILAFTFEKWVSREIGFLFYIAALFVSGLPVFFDAVRGILRRDFLDEKFLMTLASIGAMIVGEWSEGVAVMLFFLVGEFFEHKAVAKSRKSIKSLLEICPDTANVITADGEREEDAEDVAIGTKIIVRAGERVPIDSVVCEGECYIDTSSLTGESAPVYAKCGSEVKSGTIVLSGFLILKTVKLKEDSAAARILKLVEEANERKAKEESFITRFSKVYTPIVIALATLLAVIPPIFKIWPLSDSVYRALIFVVISCPCALVISVPMAFFGGIGAAAARGILFKGGNVFSPFSKLDTVAFDKTGTLTTGEVEISEIITFGISEEEALSLAASAEYASIHPISRAIKRMAQNSKKPDFAEDISGKGVKASVDGGEILVGGAALMRDFGIEGLADEGIYLAKNRRLLAHFIIREKIKEEAENAIKSLRENGARRIVMLSGDEEKKAESVGKALGLDKVYSRLLPEEKYKLIEKFNGEGNVVYVGDGINDSPSLSCATVGVAMGAIGADSAISAADVVLVSDKLDKIASGVKIAKKTVRIAKANIVFALGVKLSVMLLGALGFANMWLAVFADVGVALLAILNSMRLITMKKKL